MKHTEGTWYKDSYDEIIAMPSQTKIAKVHWIGGEETKANGHLIAAAPDLLKIAQRLVANEDQYAGAANLIIDAQKAIKKATE